MTGPAPSYKFLHRQSVANCPVSGGFVVRCQRPLTTSYSPLTIHVPAMPELPVVVPRFAVHCSLLQVFGLLAASVHYSARFEQPEGCPSGSAGDVGCRPSNCSPLQSPAGLWGSALLFGARWAIGDVRKVGIAKCRRVLGPVGSCQRLVATRRSDRLVRLRHIFGADWQLSRVARRKSLLRPWGPPSPTKGASLTAGCPMSAASEYSPHTTQPAGSARARCERTRRMGAESAGCTGSQLRRRSASCVLCASPTVRFLASLLSRHLGAKR
jgi:hypothetical protein